MIRKKEILFFILLLSVTVFHSCQKNSPIRGIELDVDFSESPLTDRLFTDIHYTWRIKHNFKGIDQDLSAFVHFWHRSNLIFHDNHRPDIPVSTWELGQEYTYTRRIYLPPFIDALDPEFRGKEILTLSIGLSFPQDKSGKPLKKIYEKKLNVFPPPSDTPEIVYDNGWFDFEIDPDTSLKRWRWTAQEAKCVIDNPHRDALLVIRGGVRKDVFRDQEVIFRIDDFILDEFIPKKNSFEKHYRINKEMLGGEDRFLLVISTDKVFIPARIDPASKDERELGIQISFIYFR
jgi:hypothetical protein